MGNFKLSAEGTGVEWILFSLYSMEQNLSAAYVLLRGVEHLDSIIQLQKGVDRSSGIGVDPFIAYKTAWDTPLWAMYWYDPYMAWTKSMSTYVGSFDMHALCGNSVAASMCARCAMAWLAF